MSSTAQLEAETRVNLSDAQLRKLDIPGAALHRLPHCGSFRRGLWSPGEPSRAAAARGRRCGRWRAATVAVRAHPVSRVGLLLLRLQLDHHQAQGCVDFDSIEVAHLLKFEEYFAAELEQLREFEALGMVRLSDEEIHVTATGWYFVRGIAMVFDRHLQSDKVRERFSRII